MVRSLAADWQAWAPPQHRHRDRDCCYASKRVDCNPPEFMHGAQLTALPPAGSPPLQVQPHLEGPLGMVLYEYSADGKIGPASMEVREGTPAAGVARWGSASPRQGTRLHPLAARAAWGAALAACCWGRSEVLLQVPCHLCIDDHTAALLGPATWPACCGRRPGRAPMARAGRVVARRARCLLNTVHPAPAHPTTTTPHHPCHRARSRARAGWTTPPAPTALAAARP